jgi:hypothetical protein
MSLPSMPSNPTNGHDDNSSNGFSPQLRAVLDQLTAARRYAEDLQCDRWEFAVEIDSLIALGATTNDLRWLAKKGYILHACEVTRASDAARKFRKSPNLSFSNKSCFLLADAALAMPENQAVVPDANVPNGYAAPNHPPSTPYWDGEDRTLYFGDQVVKEYRVLSPNQETVLSAFQEEGWPHYIDDPLPPLGDQNPKQRLRDTIRCLNDNQRNHLIRFRGDGTGERIRWEPLVSQ